MVHFNLGGRVRELITPDPDFVIYVVVPNSLDFVIRRFKRRIRNYNQMCRSSCLDFGNIGSFFVQ